MLRPHVADPRHGAAHQGLGKVVATSWATKWWARRWANLSTDRHLREDNALARNAVFHDHIKGAEAIAGDKQTGLLIFAYDIAHLTGCKVLFIFKSTVSWALSM